MRLFLFQMFLLFCFSTTILGQQDITEFKHFTIDDGLSQNSVNCIFQDKKGFIWFGTQDGLNRYDGYGFRQYRTERSNPNTLSNNYIWDLYEDEENTLWIATFGGGLNSLNLETGKIKVYTPTPGNLKSFPSKRLFAITEHPKGILWIGSNEGLIRFDKTTGESKLFLSDKNSDNTLKDNFVGTLSKDTDGNLWLRTDMGLTHFNTINNKASHFQRSPFSNAVELGNITNIVAHNGNLLVTCDAGLLRIDPKQKKDTLLFNASTVKIGGRIPTFQKVIPLKTNRIAIATNLGFLIFDPKSQKSIFLQNNPSDEKSLSNNNVLSLFQSKDGIIWIGTRNGLDKLEKENTDFVNIRNIIGGNGLSDKHVNCFIEENDSLLWVGTAAGLNLLNRNSHEFQVFKNDGQNGNELETDYILALFKDSKGNKWVGTRKNGLYKITERNQIKKVKFRNADVSRTSIHYITEDGNGNLWLGTGGKGLLKFEPATNTIKEYPTAKDSSGPNHPFVFCILEDSFKNMWVGTPTGGLNLFDPISERFIYFQNNPENPTSLSDDIILSLYEDSDHNLWVGTNGGLNKLNLRLEKNMFGKLQKKGSAQDSLFTVFGQGNGFPNDVIYGMLEDTHQNLWMSTNKGLIVFDRINEKIVKTFNVSQGLQSNEFNQNAYLKGKKGHFYFGGVAGFNIFHPDSITGNQYLPPVVLTNLSLFNEPVIVGHSKSSKKFILEKELHSLSEINLSWKHDVITIDFAALSYISPEKNKYSYKLEGFNEDWVQAGTAHTATYTNLDSGDYNFKVKAGNSSDLWNTEGASLQIHISSPPWASWYAYLVYALMLSGLFFLYVRFRINRATEKVQVLAQIEKARVQERELFRKRSSRDFHDEAGNRITRISLITELVKRNTKNSPELQKYLSQIAENLQDLNAGMRDFIWALDPTKDNVFETLQRFSEYAGQLCEYANVQFKSSEISEKLRSLELNMAQRRHLLLILKEGLNNSLKYGKAKLITLKVTYKKEWLRVSLKDDGIGFCNSETSAGNGLKNMRERAETIHANFEINSEKNHGAEIIIELNSTQMGN